MSKEYKCEFCPKIYLSYMGWWKHNNNYHKQNKSINCKYCDKKLSCKQSKWKHEKHCDISINSITLKKQVDKLCKDVKIIKEEKNIIINNTINTINTTNTINTNNTINNIQYIINPPTSNSIEHLTIEIQQDILNKGLNSLISLIEAINFNKLVPENHSYCVTAINDKHASVIDEKTNTIIKTNKFDLFDKVLVAQLDILEKISNNPSFTDNQRNEYKTKIDYLKKSIFENTKFMKRYQNDINLISYNNKDLIQETWKRLKSIDFEENEYYGDKPKGFDDLINEI